MPIPAMTKSDVRSRNCMRTEIYAMIVLATLMVVGLAYRLFITTWGAGMLPDLRPYGGYAPLLLSLGFAIGSALYYALRRRDVI